MPKTLVKTSARRFGEHRHCALWSLIHRICSIHSPWLIDWTMQSALPSQPSCLQLGSEGGQEGRGSQIPCWPRIAEEALWRRNLYDLHVWQPAGDQVQDVCFVKHRQNSAPEVMIWQAGAEPALAKSIALGLAEQRGPAALGNLGQGPNVPFASSCWGHVTLGRVWLLPSCGHFCIY